MKNKKKILNKNFLILFLVCILIFLSYLYLAKSKKISVSNLPDNIEKTELLKVKGIDYGDTIVLENGETVRYLGIDTPETHHPTNW